MRTLINSAAPAAPVPPLTLPVAPLTFLFICCGCETAHHSPDPLLPDGWALEDLGGVIFSFCPDCATDLPRGQQ